MEIADNGGRRLGVDRRQISYTACVPEKRTGQDRRSASDRRSGSDRRIGVERRSVTRTRGDFR